MQIAYYVRGAIDDSGLAPQDYYLLPSILALPHTQSKTHQLVQVNGLGLPFDPPRDFVPTTGAFEVKGRKFYANENLYLVTSSVPSSIQPGWDDIIVGIIKQDPDAIVILVPDSAETKLATPTSSEVSAKLGPQQWCNRLVTRIKGKLEEPESERLMLMEPLNVEERVNLLALTSCVLDLTGGGIGLVEAIALKVPVVGNCGGGADGGPESMACALNKVVGGDAERYSNVLEGGPGFVETAVKIGRDRDVRRKVVKAIAAAEDGGALKDVHQELGSVEGGEDVARFLLKVAAK